MTREKRYDIAVVGAGPGGALLAFLLAGRGVDVLLLDKAPASRPKPCGGGLTRRALDLLPFPLTPVIEDEARRVRVAFDGQPFFQAVFDEPVVTLVMRDRFDRFLAEKASSAGAAWRPGARVRGVFGAPGNQFIETDRGAFRARFLAGADGVNGPTARALGLTVRRRTMFALEAEADVPPDALDAFRAMVHFDFGPLPARYGWVFPKKDHLSLGVLTRDPGVKSLTPLLMEYLNGKGLAGRTRFRSLRPHLIPYAPDPGNVWANERGLVLGDAAGFTDPVTGEGIFFALKQAWMAADVLAGALDQGPETLARYQALFRKIFLPDLPAARLMNFALYRLPRLASPVLRVHGDRLGAHLLEIAAGRASYNQLFRRVFHLRWLLPVLKNYKRR